MKKTYVKPIACANAYSEFENILTDTYNLESFYIQRANVYLTNTDSSH